MKAYHKPLCTAAVIGAGTMGAQIAAHLANAGLQVLLLDMPAKTGPRSALVDRNLKAAMKAKPAPFFTKHTAQRIATGNLADDFERIAAVDWVIEAVVERLDVKQQLMARIEAHARSDAIVSTNTSGILIRDIVDGRSADFKRRALGTHFFNPPRYLELLELVPTADTDPVIVDRLSVFGRIHLGKGIVVAKDVPYFVGNRIGVYTMLGAMEYYTKGTLTIEEVDTLTGVLVGRPKSGTFRTADLVGLDVMVSIGALMYEALSADESRARFRMPAVINSLVARGRLGAKAGAGFYCKQGPEICSLDLKSGEYEAPRPLKIPHLKALKKERDLKHRLELLYTNRDKAGAFFRATTRDTLGYAARRVGEIADSPADIDKAVRWGFGWTLGPFQMWDALGFDRVRKDILNAGAALPDWVLAMRPDASFYDGPKVHIPASGTWETVPSHADEISLAAVKTQPGTALWSNEEAGLVDLGNGVALFEFRSKANTLGTQVIGGLMDAIDRVEHDPNLRGLVIGNEGKHFSAGANLKEMAGAFMMRRFGVIDSYIDAFQQAMQRVHYAAKPVVAAVHQRALGGGCELVMACCNPVAAAESYMGLVEVGVGLIPAGTGCMRFAAQASGSHAGHDSDLLAMLAPRFEQVAKADVATCAERAKEMGFMPAHTPVVMRSSRRFHVAKSTVISLSEAGYQPPVPAPIRVLGQPGFAALKIGIHQMYRGGFATDYDRHLAERVAYVMTGGDLTSAQEVTEQYLLDLERSVFLKLLKKTKTQHRIAGMLAGRPVRN